MVRPVLGSLAFSIAIVLVESTVFEQDSYLAIQLFRRTSEKFKHFNNKHNGQEEWKFGIHLTNDTYHLQDQMRTAKGNVNQSPTTYEKQRSFSSSRFIAPFHAVIPDRVDWREHGLVTHVRSEWIDGGSLCSADYATAAAGALEAQYARATGKLIALSEQNIIDCSQDYGNLGCEGGSVDMSFDYIKANGGIDTLESYKYIADDQECKFKNDTIGATLTGYVDIEEGNEEALRMAVATIGPVAAMIDGHWDTFRHYKGGIYYEPRCWNTVDQVNHAVLVVGYGTDEESGQQYWICKNNQGVKWGEDGYVRLARNKQNHCGIACGASYPLV